MAAVINGDITNKKQARISTSGQEEQFVLLLVLKIFIFWAIAIALL